MNKSTLPVGIKTMIGWKNKGTLTFDNPIQRSGSQWTLLQKSLLIHSILMGYPIPNCYFLKTKDENGNTVYDCLDAKQRLTSVFDFVEGEYELHSATPPCTVDGFEFDLANLSFEELADDLKDEILGCRMSIFCLEDCTDEEVEEIFARLNNSTPLSPIQKCRSIMSTELARWTKEICSMDFFQHSIGLTVAQLRREADLEVLLQSMLLLDSRHEGYDEWKGISTAEVTKYCKHIRGKYNDDKKLMIMELFEYLGKAFREQHKFLKKSNIPMVIVLSKLALENDIEAEKFKVFIDCSFIEGDRYAIREGNDRVFPITYINRCEQEGLILINNSQRGIYTHTKHLDRLVINALKKLDIDILLAVCVDEDDMYNLLFAIKDFEPVNFDYGKDLFNYCRKFEYDWRRDLPDIARLIDMKYPEGCEIVLTYREWFEAGVICDKKIFAKTLLKEKLRSRRLAIMLIDFMKDESVRLSKINSTKNPDTRLLFDDLPSVADDVKRTFYLIIDIDETIRSERDIVDYCIYGGWINKEFVEVLGKEEALPIFEDLIPFILREEMILCG